MTSNPLLSSPDQPHGALNLSEVRTEHFLPALKTSIEDCEIKIQAIRDQLNPDFENTILALECADEHVDIIMNVFSNFSSCLASPELMAIAPEFFACSSEYFTGLTLDEKLFARVQSVYEKRNELDLQEDDLKVTENSYDSFARNGALLPPDKKAELKLLNKKLAKLSPQFSENVLRATKSFSYSVTDDLHLAGLPQFVIDMAKENANKDSLPNAWNFNLDMPMYMPTLKYASHRELREKLWRAFSSRSFGGEFDNTPLVKEIAELRHEKALLLGFKSHADYVLVKRMAKSPATVTEFLEDLYQVAKPAAEADLANVKAMAKELAGPSELMPWDFAYYSEKLRTKCLDWDPEELRPYFPLSQVTQGAFKHAEILFDLSFKQTDIPAYHEDVKVYEVTKKSTGEYQGLFYADFFPRDTKRGGAWMTIFQASGLSRGEVQRPHVSIVTNFPKPAEGKTDSLLGLEEVLTLFHEFGHALHTLLCKTKYRSLSSINVYWDFVELPSQLLENWAKDSEGLALFAKHHETAAPLPKKLIDKIQKNEQFLSGYQSLRQVSLSLLDMAWHDLSTHSIEDVDKFEKSALSKTSLFPPMEHANISCSFGHIFAGGYSAGYYSYKWAEVLDADAFELFKQKGLFDKNTANSYCENILEAGASEHPMDLYTRFRGQAPDPKALLRRSGLL